LSVANIREQLAPDPQRLRRSRKEIEMRSVLMATVVALSSGLMAQSATAAEIYDEITLSQLENVLSKSFNVKRDKESDILFVEGKDNLIGASVGHCGDGPKCETIRYWGVLKKSYSLSQANAFNLGYDYAKIVANSKGQIVIRSEVLAAGGVSDENIRLAAAMLMVREDQANESVVAQMPGSSSTAMLSSPKTRGDASELGAKMYKGPPRMNDAANAMLRAVIQGESQR
jgi:hypothetical protein